MFTFDDNGHASYTTDTYRAYARIRGDVVEVDLYPRHDPYLVISTDLPLDGSPEDTAADALALCCEELREVERAELERLLDAVEVAL